MSRSAVELIYKLSGEPFIIQFVLSLLVDDADNLVTQIKTFLITATSAKEARETAQGMIESLADRYRNQEGKVVTVRCEGIHSVDELELVDSDGQVELANFLYSPATRSHHLIHEGKRQDLPLLE